jgi:DNA-binding NtrC family response regulator
MGKPPRPRPLVLVVDDDHALRSALRRTLVQASFECVEAGTARDALAMLETQSVDVALVDIRLPDESGLVLVEHLRSLDPPIPCVVMSGGDELRAAAESSGAVRFLDKPVSSRELLSALQDAMAADR